VTTLLDSALSTSDSGNASDPAAFYERHIFCCTNERPEGHPRGSCARGDAVKLRNYMKARAKEIGLTNVRVNTAGCLDRCELGCTMVIYPEGVWYTFASMEDVDEILESHIQNGGRVPRLMLDTDDKDHAGRIARLQAEQDSGS